MKREGIEVKRIGTLPPSIGVTVAWFNDSEGLGAITRYTWFRMFLENSF